VGKREGLGQGRAARHLPDLQLDGAGRSTWSASGLRPGQSASDLLALLALPGTILGASLGARVYHALSDRNFRDVVLALLFLSGIGLVWSSLH